MLLKNVKIYTMQVGIIETGYVFIENGKIAALGDMSDFHENDFCNMQTLDLTGMNVYPGFVDAHNHAGIFNDSVNFEGADGNEENDPITPHLRSIDSVNPMDKSFFEALKAGVTTLITGPGSSNPIGGQIIALKSYGRRVDDMIIKDPVAIKFALGENPKSVYNDKNQAPATRMSTAALIREQLYKAKRYSADKKLALDDPDTDFPEYDAKNEALIPLLDREIQAHFHTHRADDIFTAIRIAREFNLDYVLVHATEGHIVARELLAENAKILSGPFMCDRSKPELVNLSPSSPGILASSGLLTAIVTDHPVTPIQYLPICAAIAIREGMDKYEALKAITINPAKICGISDRVGSIAVGKDADLVVFACDVFDLLSKPLMIIAGGCVVSR